MSLWIAVTLLGVIGLFAALFAVAVYNRLIKFKSDCENSFAQIELQLKRRYDLIPNLVNCVKSYMAHEKSTLECVIAARSRAVAGLQQTTSQPQDPAALQDWLGAEIALSSALNQLTVAIESYPELKADKSVAQLSEELRSTENRIAFARQAYNDWVTGFNNCRQTFPNCVFAGMFGFVENRKHLEFADAQKLADAPPVMLA